MPEEINRLLTDQISDLLLTPSQDGNDNLLREGIAPEKIHLVGNVMIDTLVHLSPKAEARWPQLQQRFQLQRYLLVTLHRPSNVDDPAKLREIMQALDVLSRHLPVVFPVHPRTRRRVLDLGIATEGRDVQLIEPLGYLDFLAFQAHAALVVTDSGGVQEETTYLGVPCLTLRPNTERPVTISQGTNQLVSSTQSALIDAVETTLHRYSRMEPGTTPRPALWDGHTAERIVAVLQQVAA